MFERLLDTRVAFQLFECKRLHQSLRYFLYMSTHCIEPFCEAFTMFGRTCPNCVLEISTLIETTLVLIIVLVKMRHCSGMTAATSVSNIATSRSTVGVPETSPSFAMTDRNDDCV